MNRLVSSLVRAASRGLHTHIGGASSVVTSHPMAATRPTRSVANSRLLSSVDTEESDSNPLSLVDDDMRTVYNEVMSVLRSHVRNKVMFDIADYYYKGMEDNVGAGSAITILIAKALNKHVLNDEKLTDVQVKVLAIIDLMMSTILLRDDIVDEAETRRGFPAAHLTWNVKQVTAAGNMINVICVAEAAKLRNNVTASVCQLGEAMYRGQFMSFWNDRIPGDPLENYMEEIHFKGASLIRFICASLARTVGSPDRVEEDLARFGHQFGMSHCIVDGIRDLREDLKAGMLTAPVLLAMRDEPRLEKMARRRFAGQGDVERAVELVNGSKGLVDAKELGRRYFGASQRCLDFLVDSPYKSALQTVCQFQMLSVFDDDSEEASSAIDMLAEKGF